MRHRRIKIGLLWVVCLATLSAWADETVVVDSPQNRPREAFILFYKASCPHCRRFNPILKAYALKHHIPVLAYTLDGWSLPSFPRSLLPTQAEMDRFFYNRNPVVPTLFLMDLNQHYIVPVLQGEASTHQLEYQLQQIHVWDERNVPPLGKKK